MLLFPVPVGQSDLRTNFLPANILTDSNLALTNFTITITGGFYQTTFGSTTQFSNLYQSLKVSTSGGGKVQLSNEHLFNVDVQWSFNNGGGAGSMYWNAEAAHLTGSPITLYEYKNISVLAKQNIRLTDFEFLILQNTGILLQIVYKNNYSVQKTTQEIYAENLYKEVNPTYRYDKEKNCQYLDYYNDTAVTQQLLVCTAKTIKL